MRYLLLCWIIGIGLLGAGYAHAEAVIRQLDVQATLDVDGRLSIEERFILEGASVAAQDVERRISRIPEGTDGSSRFWISSVVMMRDGFSERGVVEQDADALHIRFRNEGRRMGAAGVYTVKYVVHRAIQFFDTRDEAVWNVTSNAWREPIEHVSFTLKIPEGMPVESVITECVTGIPGSSERACTVEPRDHEILVNTTRVLGPWEGVIVRARFPKDVFSEPSILQRLYWLFWDRWIVGIPFGTAFFLFLLWWKRGRDPALGTLSPQSRPPENVSPAFAAYVRNEGSASGHALLALIVDLARRGYLRISVTSEDTSRGVLQSGVLQKARAMDDMLVPEERRLLEFLFRKKGSYAFSDFRRREDRSEIHLIESELHRRFTLQGWFDHDPAKTRAFFLVFAVAVVGTLQLMIGSFPGSLSVSLVTGGLLVGFGWIMPRRTALGMNVLEQLEGFRIFLSTSERSSSMREVGLFEQWLPFALALKVEESWVQQWNGSSIQMPEWMEDEGRNQTTSVRLLSHLRMLQKELPRFSVT